MADDDETVVLTYRELAERLGIKPASAKARALRNRWRTTGGNDGLARVSVPVSALERLEPAAEPTTEPPSPGNDMLRQIADMQRDNTARLDRLLTEHSAAIAQLRQDHGAELATVRRDMTEAHKAELDRMLRTHEAEVARLTTLFAELNRPWWRRWWKG